MSLDGLWKWIKAYLIALFGCVVFLLWFGEAKAYDVIGGYAGGSWLGGQYTAIADPPSGQQMGAVRIYGINDEMLCALSLWFNKGYYATNTQDIIIKLRETKTALGIEGGRTIAQWTTTTLNTTGEYEEYLTLPICMTLWNKSIENVEYWVTIEAENWKSYGIGAQLNYGGSSSTQASYWTWKYKTNGTWKVPFTDKFYQPYLKYGFSSTGLSLDYAPMDFENATGTSFTDPDFGVLGNYIYRALKFLFWPTQDQIDGLEEKKDALLYKVPWGYVRLLRIEFLALDTASTTTHWTLDFKGYDGNATATIDITQSYLDTPTAARDFAEVWLVRIMWAWFVVYVCYRAIDSINNL